MSSIPLFVQYPCRRCGGAGARDFPTWLPYKLGMCFRCKGDGVDPKDILEGDAMCGTLKFEGTVIKYGGSVVVETADTLADCKWSGFAKVERFKEWMHGTNAVHCKVQVDSFVEGKATFAMPKDWCMEGLWMGSHDGKFIARDIAPERSVKILTRKPLNPFEAKIHKRWPVVRDPANPRKYFQWTSKDVIEGQVQHQLL
jgi:hypothetical protein